MTGLLGGFGRFGLVIMMLLACAARGEGARILIVSDRGLVGDVIPAEDGLVDLLERLGHQVDTSGLNQAYHNGSNPFGEAKLQALNDADLILISRNIDSGQYDAPNRVNWNSLETPILSMSVFVTRASRWQWFTGGEVGGNPANPSETSMLIAAGQENHPFVQGFESPIQLYDWAPGTTAPGVGGGQGLHRMGLGSVRPGSIVVGTFAGNAFLVDIPSGTPYGTDSNEEPLVFGGRRVLMPHWGNYTDYAAHNTPDYEQLLGQVIAAIVGESSTPGDPGDVNGDGHIDRLDLVAMLQNYGRTGATFDQGDMTGDGLVGLADLAVVQALLGTEVGQAAASAAAVPEPSAAVLAAVGLAVVGMLAARRRRRRRTAGGE